MDQQVIIYGELNYEGLFNKNKVINIRPETKWTTLEQAEMCFYIKGRTRDCCNSLRWFVGRGDSPVKLSNSWFSAKYISVYRTSLF